MIMVLNARLKIAHARGPMTEDFHSMPSHIRFGLATTETIQDMNNPRRSTSSFGCTLNVPKTATALHTAESSEMIDKLKTVSVVGSSTLKI